MTETQFSAGGVVIKPSGDGCEVLLIKDSYGHWTWAKGHIEQGETPQEAAAREITEETGLKTLEVLEEIGKQQYWFSLEGKYIKEFRIHELPSFTWLHHFCDSTYYFIGHRIPSTEGKAMVLDVLYDLISATEGGQEIEKLTSFPVESFAISSGGGRAMASIAEFTSAPYKGKYLAICHTQEYLLKIYDLESQKTVRSFRRKYRRVKVPPGRKVGGSIGVKGKTYSPPRTYLNDITRIFAVNEHFWIMTSTSDEKKGVLIDVFDFEGRYIDNFYLKIPGKIDPIFIGYTPMTLSENLLHMRVRNEDETYSFKKYRIEDKGSK